MLDERNRALDSSFERTRARIFERTRASIEQFDVCYNTTKNIHLASPATERFLCFLGQGKSRLNLSPDTPCHLCCSICNFDDHLKVTSWFIDGPSLTMGEIYLPQHPQHPQIPPCPFMLFDQLHSTSAFYLPSTNKMSENGTL